MARKLMARSAQKRDVVDHDANRFSARLSPVGLIAIMSAIPVVMMLLISTFQRVPVEDLTRDVTAISQVPPYAGFLSQIGLLFWAAAATVCFFSAIALPSTQTTSLKIRRFLLISAMLTVLLGLDDAFLLHEDVLPNSGIPENALYAGYVGLFLAYLYKFYPVIFKTNYRLIAMALTFFILSVSLDVVHLLGPIAFLFKGSFFSIVEDTAKFIGIVSWLIYFFQVGQQSIKLSVAQQP